MAARARGLCTIANAGSPAAVAKNARRGKLVMVSTLVFSAMAHSVVKDVSLESRRVRSQVKGGATGRTGDQLSSPFISIAGVALASGRANWMFRRRRFRFPRDMRARG